MTAPSPSPYIRATRRSSPRRWPRPPSPSRWPLRRGRPPYSGSMGQSAVVTHKVTDDDTAIALCSGDVPVLATPRIVALCEQATCDAFADHLEEGQTTVGT